MTDNPFAALLAKIGRYSHDCDEPHLVPEPDGKWLDRDEVLAALAAAVPADLAEAGKVVERLEDEAITLSGIGINRGSVDASLSAQAADEAADLITALLARIAAQEAQMKGLGAEITATDDLMAADSCRIAALETALAAQEAQIERLEIVAQEAKAGWRDAESFSTEQKTDALKWFDLAHQNKLRAEAAETAIAAERAKVEAVIRIAASLFPGGYDNNHARICSAITEAGQ